MIGPLTETQAAAAYYTHAVGWPVGCTSRAVWLCLPAQLVALAVPEPLADDLPSLGPVIHYPGQPRYQVHIVNAPTSTDHQATPLLNARGIIRLGYRSLLDLPPTRIPEGPLTWTSSPVPGRDLPTFANVVRELQGTGLDLPASH